MKLSKIIAVADISYYWKLIKCLIGPAHSTITSRVKKNRSPWQRTGTLFLKRKRIFSVYCWKGNLLLLLLLFKVTPTAKFISDHLYVEQHVLWWYIYTRFCYSKVQRPLFSALRFDSLIPHCVHAECVIRKNNFGADTIWYRKL